MKRDEWTGCYPSNWKGKIVPEAMTHPAKYSSRLIHRIYQHILVEGWVRPGDSVVDPFGGVALGALDAMRMGLNWYGVELEEKFWKLGNQNLELWVMKYGRMPHWGQAMLAQGDSRRLMEVLGLDFGMAVSSPPFRQREGGRHEPKPGGPIDAALYARHSAGNGKAKGYGDSDGQLANMGEGNFETVISSPPFGGSELTDNRKTINKTIMGIGRKDKKNPHGGRLDIHNGSYGEGNLANMKAVISSPPYAEARVGKESGQEHCGQGDQYGETEGQLGGTDDFWSAARLIVEQVYGTLKPGGHACWVVKDYVKDRQIVPFTDQWRQLCEAVGFVTVHEHHALLVRNKRVQHTLDGGSVTLQAESKSFFRRLAEAKGSPRIDWETVLCMEVKDEFKLR